MSIKSKILTFTTFLSSWAGSSAQEQKPEHNDSVPTPAEKITDRNIHQFEDSCFNTNEASNNAYNLADSIKVEVDSTKIDSLRERILTPEQADSIANVRATENFENARYDMLCFIAHCEGVKARAYWDPKGKCYTIGIGNTIRPDGKKVRAGDFIKNEEELLQYFNTHLDKYMFNDMKNYLPLDSMEKAEIVAVGSLVYNCGSGILKTKNNELSNFAKDIKTYVETKGDTTKSTLNEVAKSNILAYFSKKIYAGGHTLIPLVKRRDLEVRVFLGEILLGNSEEMKLENSVDFSKVALGGIYGISSIKKKDSTDISSHLRETMGKNLTDTISSQFNKLPRKSYNRVNNNIRNQRAYVR